MSHKSLTTEQQQELERLAAEVAQAEADAAAANQRLATLRKGRRELFEEFQISLFAPEWLGDFVVSDNFFKQLTNVNQHRNGIGKIPHGPYSVMAEFDIDTGEFRQLRLSVAGERENTKQPSVYEKRGIVFLD